jgi:hypothetical protein
VGRSGSCSSWSRSTDRPRLGQEAIEAVLQLLIEFLHLLGRHHSFGDEALGPHLACRRVLPDARVERRLRVRRLVALVVPPATVAHEVDQEVLAEGRRDT